MISSRTSLRFLALVAVLFAVACAPVERSDDASGPCRNSRDPACGPFRWDKTPGADGPLSVEVTFTPKAPRVGQEVRFAIVAKDDGGVPYSTAGDYGDGTNFGGGEVQCTGRRGERYGVWTLQEQRPLVREETKSHTYERAGVFTASFTYSTNLCNFRRYNPYGSDGSAKVTLTVK